MGRSRVVVFDLDGTLIDSAPGIRAALTAAFQKVAPGLVIADPATAIGPPVRRMVELLAPELTEDLRTEVVAEFRARYDAHEWRRTVPMPGALELLDALRHCGMGVRIATFKPTRPTELILGHLGLSARVDVSLSPDGPGGPWSEKGAMIRALLAPGERAVYVGDTEDDRRAATVAGVPFIAFAPGAPSVPGRVGRLSDAADQLVAALGE